MRGHEHLISQRLHGHVPSIVFVNDFPCKTDWWDWRESATVCTANDALSSLDLRFLVGLRVSISANTEGRAKALFERAKAAGAAVVAGCHVEAGMHASSQHGWADIYCREGGV